MLSPHAGGAANEIRGRRLMKPVLLVATLAFILVLAVVAGISLNRGGAPAQAQDAVWPAPANVRAADGANPGAVAVSWDAVAGAPFYRIGWVAMDDVAAARAEGRDWLDAFAFSDVANRGQTSHTVKPLTAGVHYAFIAASINRRFGDASWSEWVLLTPGAGETGAELTPTPTPIPTLRPTPTGMGDYDTDKDGLIEISNLAQLAAIRADLNGDGISPAPAYAAAFPNAMPGMGCPDAGCTGYELVANLDFDTNGNGAADAGDAYWNNSAGWIPIGDRRHAFTADFDGNNHTIANLYINRSRADRVGLFGSVSSSSIKRVGLVSAAVLGDDYVGGLVGFSVRGTISDSYAAGAVSGRYYVGGLVGYSSLGTISGSYAAGAVSGNYYVGGLVGYSHYRFTRYNIISGSYATGSVSGGDYVGGLVGSSNYGSISSSYATGSVSGSGDDIGGLVGHSESTSIIASYAVGRVSASGDTLYIGGLIGYDEGSDIAASYWDTETSGQAGSYGGIGKTTAELQSPDGYTGIYAGWNLDLDGDSIGDDPWHFGNSGQYPALQYAGLDPAAQRR